MSFLAVELRVIERDVPRVARLSGVHEDRLYGGLLRLWHRCWADKIDVVDTKDLASIFGPAEIEKVIDALCLDFLEPGDGLYRVRGVERYLRIRQAQSDGAKKANARRWAKKTAEPADLESDHDGESAIHQSTVAPPTTDCQSTDSVLTTERRSTEHRVTVESRSSGSREIQRVTLSPITCARDGEQPATPSEPLPLDEILEFSPVPLPRPKDPRLKELQTALEETFEQATGARYKFAGAKDMQALKRILGHGTSVDEAVSRFRRGILEKGWLGARTIAQLDSKWNDLATVSHNRQFLEPTDALDLPF